MKIHEFNSIKEANDFLHITPDDKIYDVKIGFVNGQAKKVYITVYGGTVVT